MTITLTVFHQKKFKKVLDKNTGDKVEVSPNILKHSFGSKSLYLYVNFFMILSPCSKLDEAELKLEDSRGKNQTYTVKTHKNV